MASGTGSPCGACKFLRRKCASNCIFAPYFCSEQGPAQFAAIHKVFGASNVSKLLLHIPVADRCEAIVSIAYEAQARVKDPVHGCVAHIFALQQQVAHLQAQLMQTKAQLAHNLNNSQLLENHRPQNIAEEPPHVAFPSYMNSVSPQSSLDSIDFNNDGMAMQDDLSIQTCTKKMLSQNDLGELQALALRMMRN